MELFYAEESESKNDQRLSQEPDSAKVPAKREIDKSFCRISPDKHLEEARKALADGYKVDVNPMKTVWGRLNDANRHLKAISPEAPQYAEARELVDEVHLRQRKMKYVCENAMYEHMVKQREMLVNQLEQYFATKGISAEIELSGSGKTYMRVSSSMFKQGAIDRIADETSFFSHLHKAGFTNILFENNAGKVKSYQLETQ